ncbi:MAG: DNA repair protein RecN [Clostridia bacterium]|nr:DNA repair protein RecN [Clostridia bacterium]
MILSLHIENIAVVKKLDVDMKRGFTVLSGETGAGKSIIIDCLNLLGGVRADKDMIRSGEKTAEVSAVFCDINEKAAQKIKELGFSLDDGCLMLSRTVNSDSASSARLNGRVIPISVLREISSLLFNIHGQNDNQTLLDKRNHLGIIDAYAGCGELLGEYREIYGELLRLRERIDSFNKDVMEMNRLREMLKYQIDDINSIKLRQGEEEALLLESQKLQNSERIRKNYSFVDRALNGSEKGVGAIYLVEKAENALLQLSNTLPEAVSLAERLVNVKYEIDDIAATLASIADISEDDPTARIDKIESRLEAISRLKKKYGSTVEDILNFRDNAQTRLDLIENSEDEIIKLTESLNDISYKASQKAIEIRKKRLNAARSLTLKITEALEFLDMPKVKFDISLEALADFDANGLDRAEFLISANPGEPMMPIDKIASGGELARIMLSLKSVLNECDGIDTAIFDEIDTGISGKTSRKVGIKLREISRNSQVVCVTHSAQIASLASNHLFISKSEADGRVATDLKELDYDGRVEEIARILGGIEISDIQRQAAREMIDEDAGG